MTGVADDYTEVMRLLGRQAVVLDIRGHRRSSAPASGYDLATLSRDVGTVVDAVTDGLVHMVTFPRGTTYAVAWAIENPDRVRWLAIGDYVPRNACCPKQSRVVYSTAVGAGLLCVSASSKTPRSRRFEPRGDGRTGRLLPDCNSHCSWYVAATASLSATTTGRATKVCSPTLN
jgi:pimeloyl-ACP methyl ester carboxylesterase